MGVGFRAKKAVFATIAVVLMFVVALVPIAGCEGSEVATDHWTYTITSEGKVTSSGSQVQGFKAPVSYGSYNKDTSGYDTGAWGFDDAGFGPFGSFYAAFDACHGNKIICHLDPDNLKRSVDGSISVDTSSDVSPYKGHTVNIMWVLPTVYWSVDGSGNLVLTNDPDAGGKAYAHTIDGDVHEYLGIGVYEASTAEVGGKTVLTSTSGVKPLYGKVRSVFREYANNNTVATVDGSTVTGHAMLWNFYAWQLYRFSVLTVGGSWDSQGVFGNGDSWGANFGPQVKSTGGLDGSGPYAGAVGSSGYNSYCVKAFVENAWGGLYDYVDGVLIYYEDGEIKLFATQVAEPTDSADDYTTKIGTLPSTYGYGSTTTSSETDPRVWGLPTAGDGSATSGLYDRIFSDMKSSRTSPYGFLAGGVSYGSGNASDNGISFMHVSSEVSGSSYNTKGSRLAFVFDKDPTPVHTVRYDHTNLTALGASESAVSALPQSIRILSADDTYADLGIVDGFKHVGWRVDGTDYACTQAVASFSDHTALSLWEAQKVTFDHMGLTALGASESAVLGLRSEMPVNGNTAYPQLGNVDGFKHVGWKVGDTEVGPTAAFVTTDSHTAYSLWEAQKVTYDHSGLREKLMSVGGTESEMSGLPSGIEMHGNTGYGQLPDVGEFIHTGWLIDGVEYPATHAFVSSDSHTAISVWMGLPAVTYDHSQLIGATGDDSSVAGLSTGMEMSGRTNYEKLPDRDGFQHVGWMIGDKTVGPTAGFVTQRTHTAVSLWSALPTAELDHHGLIDIVGSDAGGVSDLPTILIIPDNEGYVQLPDIAGYRHIGWSIGGRTVGPTAGFVSDETHTAVSLWERIVADDDRFVPMIPDVEEPVVIPPVPQSGETGLWGKAGLILLIALVAVIVAEIAVLCISRKR